MLSVGDWQWDSNATGYYYNGQGQPLADLKGTIASDIYAPDHAKSEVQLKGVKVLCRLRLERKQFGCWWCEDI